MVKYTTLHLWFTPTRKYKVTQKVHAKSLKGSTLQAGFSFTHTNRYTVFFTVTLTPQHSTLTWFPFPIQLFNFSFTLRLLLLLSLSPSLSSWLLTRIGFSFLFFSCVVFYSHTSPLYYFFFFNSFRAPLKNRPLFKFLRIPITGKPSKSSFFFIIICVFYFLHFPFSSTTLLFVHTCMLLMNTDSETVLLLLIFGFAWMFCLYVVFHFQLGVLFFIY